MAKRYSTTVDVFMPPRFLYVDPSVRYRDPFAVAVYELQNKMSPQLFEWDPERAPGNLMQDRCMCDACRKRRG